MKNSIFLYRLTDVCVLLNMPKGFAMTLINALSDKEEQYDASEILINVGIFTLQKNEVLSILSRRTFLD